MNCDCIKLTDEKLAEMNMALDTSFLLGEDLSLLGQTLSIGTHWKDPSKKVRGKKPTTIIVNYCPFCGASAYRTGLESGFTPRPLETQAREVQCADCFAWFSPAANHTCCQQVRRNQRSAKR